MTTLWGKEIDVELREDPPEFHVPQKVVALSKKCRRLLIVACQKGRVQKKDGDSHFDELIEQGMLTSDGKPTDRGRHWYEKNG